MSCEDQIDTEDLINAKLDSITLGEVATSRAGAIEGGTPITISTNRFGEATDTVQGRLDKLGIIYDDPIRDWSASLLVSDLRAHRYPATTGDIYIPKKELPFTTGGTFNTGDWVILQGLTVGDMNAELINDLTQAYEFDSLALMLSSIIVFPVKKVLNVKDGGTATSYKVQAGVADEPLAGGLWARILSSWDVVPNERPLSLHNDGSLLDNHGFFRVAHRNGGYGIPNSIYNYSSMIDSGLFDAIELDMSVSSDGVLYNFHDFTVDALTDGTGEFSQLSSGVLDGLKFTSAIGTVFDLDPIPRLASVFDFARETGIWVIAEIKQFRGVNTTPQLGDIELMIDLASDYGLKSKFIISAFDISFLEHAVSYDSSINVLNYASFYNEAEAVATAALETSGTKSYCIEYSQVDGTHAELIRNKGMIPSAWNANDINRQRELLNFGFTFQMSDKWEA